MADLSMTRGAFALGDFAFDVGASLTGAQLRRSPPTSDPSMGSFTVF